LRRGETSTKPYMRPIFTLVFAAACGVSSLSAQVSKIEQKSRENNSPSSNSGSNNSSGSRSSSGGSSGSSPKYNYDSDERADSYYYYDNSPSYNSGGNCSSGSSSNAPYNSSGGDACVDGCSGCFSFVSDIFETQKKLVRDKENPMATSVELMPHVAYGSMQILSYIPRIRASFGIISSDFRVTSLNDVSTTEGGTYYTYDWQILQLNLINNRNFGFYFGGGLMSEHTSATVNDFFEVSAGFLVREFGKWSGALEWRSTDAAPTGVMVRSELGARVSYTFLEKKPVYVNLTAGTIYQNYYESISVWSGVGGFSLVLK
jgi:hypothetical protein